MHKFIMDDKEIMAFLESEGKMVCSMKQKKKIKVNLD